MLSKIFQNVAITGISCAVPSKIVKAEEYIDRFGERAVERFVEGTGIKERRVSILKQTASDLCFVAAEKILEHKNIDRNEIDACIFITQFPDYKIPSTAYVLHHRLNLKQDCLVFDINLGCAAFVNGIYILAGMIESGTIDKALLLIGDIDHEYKNDEDITFSMMFGDAGSAVLIERGEGSVYGMIRSDGSGFRTILTPKPGARFPKQSDEPLKKTMSGEDTFLFTITKVPKLFKEFYSTFGFEKESFDYYILHQANQMIVNQIAKKLKIDSDRFPLSLDRYGNTDGASIPLTIVDLKQKKDIKDKYRFITSGFGVGLSWGIVSFDINSEDILPITETDDYYAEGCSL